MPRDPFVTTGRKPVMGSSKTHELRNRILFTVFMLAVYLIGKSIILYGADTSDRGTVNGQYMVAMMFSGDRYHNTLMALGIMPYINASLLVQIVTAFRSSDARAKISKQRSDRWMLITTVVIAAFMAVIQSADVSLLPGAGPEKLVRGVVILEMFAGAMITYFLCMKNEDLGVGASMPIILVNILTSLAGSISANHFFRYPRLMVLCAVVVAATAFLENSIIKIPLQRVSIHNIHADKNYMAYKRNPVGIMPVMFATVAFVIPRYFVRMLTLIFPENVRLAEIRRSMVMTKPEGIAVYLVIVVLLSVAFSFIMLNPMESARQLQKNGDSIIGVYAGEKTKKYLVRLVLRLSVVSGLLQAAGMALSLIMMLKGELPVALAMMPSSAMILVSIICSTAQEIATYRRYDAYKFFF